MSQFQNEVKNISVDCIRDPAWAMRTEMDNTGLQELAQSIREVGLIEPIIVRVSGDGFEVVAGHRRLCAARMAGVPAIRCVVVAASDEETEIIKVHENLFREDVDPVDEAFFIAKTIERLQCTAAKFAGMINRSEQYVRDRLSIISYDQYLIDYIKRKKIPLAVAKFLCEISDPVQRRVFVDYAADHGVTASVARMWLNDSRQGTLPTVVDEIDPAALPHDLPQKVWTVDCVICGGRIPVKEAKLSYAHSDCLAEIQK